MKINQKKEQMLKAEQWASWIFPCDK